MAKPVVKVFAFVLIALISTSCNSASSSVEDEILIPTYEFVQSRVNTVKAEIMDLTSQKIIASELGCPYAEALVAFVEGNLTEFNPARKEFKAGEVIAVIDASDLSLEFADGRSTLNAAEQKYKLSGSARDKAAYEIELNELEKLNYRLSKYVITAPYDCIIIQPLERSVGDFIEVGEVLCKIARYEEIFVYTYDYGELFAVGLEVDIKMGSFSYKGETITCPSQAPEFASAKRISAVRFNAGELDRVFEDNRGALNAGWATLYVTDADKRGALAVPSSAVIKSGDKSFCILSSGDDGERVRIAVEAGETINGYTVILSGLSEGDEVFV